MPNTTTSADHFRIAPKKNDVSAASTPPMFIK
jgi:hypothetical protein